MTKTETVKAGVDLALKEFGAIHILVNCAGSGWVSKTVGQEGRMTWTFSRRSST